MHLNEISQLESICGWFHSMSNILSGRQVTTSSFSCQEYSRMKKMERRWKEDEIRYVCSGQLCLARWFFLLPASCGQHRWLHLGGIAEHRINQSHKRLATPCYTNLSTCHPTNPTLLTYVNIMHNFQQQTLDTYISRRAYLIHELSMDYIIAQIN